MQWAPTSRNGMADHSIERTSSGLWLRRPRLMSNVSYPECSDLYRLHQLTMALIHTRQPDGEANVDLMLGEYRKLDPGPVEEFIFFDHASGRTRIAAATRWKAEHPESASPQELAKPLSNSS